MPTVEISCENDIGYVRKNTSCIDKALLTSVPGAAICGIYMLKNMWIKTGTYRWGH